jgi:oxygen-independent coproporphyrinogen-3 oxidase
VTTLASQTSPTTAPDVRALLDTVSLYLHIPFCQAKCHYCDFNSYAGMLGWRERYVDALAAEIELAGARARPAHGERRRCRTIFFGGGTPSLLRTAQVARLLDTVRASFALDDDAEITLEANPGALERGHLGELRAAGVNRLSMGAQSFDADLLRWMGRIHTPEEIGDAVHAARHAGFTSINLDFIFALPGQSIATWSETLDRALELRPEHLSLYSLIVEEGTPLHRWVAQGRVRPAEEDVAADMYELAERRLAQGGYAQYEISNWAQPGHACAHNLTYWHNLPYIGLGAGAHGWFAGRRYCEARPIHDYVARVERALAAAPGAALAAEALPAAAVVEDEEIGRELEMGETAMLGLRLNDGVDLDAFAARYGVTFDAVFGERLAEVASLGLLERDDGRLRLTERGRLLGNEVFERVLPE